MTKPIKKPTKKPAKRSPKPHQASTHMRWARIKAQGVPRLSGKGLSLVCGGGALVFVLNLLMLLADYYQWQASMTAIIVAVIWAIGLVLGVVLFWTLGELVWLCHGRAFLQSLQARRTLNSNLPVHAPSQVRLQLMSALELPSWLTLEVIDHAPEGALMAGLPVMMSGAHLASAFDVGTPAQDSRHDGQILNHHDAMGAVIDYELTPVMRGVGVFGGIGMVLWGRFGLWAWHCELPVVEGINSVRVFANFKTVLSDNLFAMAQKSAIDGALKRRLRGHGQDFHQIRAYHEGDSIRHIDWRATSRLSRLMSKEYQDEQEQELLFLLDASQNMRHQRLLTEQTHTQMASSHLDSVLDSMLLLANTANQQGDATGFIGFSGNQDKVAPPKKGAGVINYLLNQSFELHTSLNMPDYIKAARMALQLLKKRGLILLMTSTRSENFEELLTAVRLLSAKHLVVVANLYEEDLATFMASAPDDIVKARTYHSISYHLQMQRSLEAHLSCLPRVSVIHCTPNALPARLTQTYLRLKQQQKF